MVSVKAYKIYFVASSGPYLTCDVGVAKMSGLQTLSLKQLHRRQNCRRRRAEHEALRSYGFDSQSKLSCSRLGVPVFSCSDALSPELCVCMSLVSTEVGRTHSPEGQRFAKLPEKMCLLGSTFVLFFCSDARQ